MFEEADAYDAIGGETEKRRESKGRKWCQRRNQRQRKGQKDGEAWLHAKS